MYKKYIVLIMFLLLPLAASGCQATAQAAEDPELELLVASGTIRATEVRIASEFGGRIQALHTKVGDDVRTGDVLVELDTTPWLLQLSPAEAAVATAKADLAVLQAGPRTEEIAAARASLTLVEVQRDSAFRAWQNAQAVVENPQDIDAQIVEARTQVALAAQGVELAEAELSKEWVMRDISQDREQEQREAADLQYRAAEEALAAAQADEKTAQALLNQLWGIRNNPLGYITQANVAHGQYLIAQTAVTIAQTKLDDVLAGPAPEEIAVAQAEVRRAEAEADVLRVKIERSTLYSPINGVVVAQSLRMGELAAPAATILTLADLAEVMLDVYVPENRIGYVTLGQRVQVTVDSFPGRVFEGEVARIGDEPEFTPRNVATAEDRLNTFYVVEIRLANPEGVLKPGMPADAEF
ncbi:MAG: efflux RND transporter periplasmic adaptor subunit [Anaerolineae bacterium]|nr:efflux RND transporter periplasmic adaptor subunit [Anaerolineae bacterium]